MVRIETLQSVLPQRALSPARPDPTFRALARTLGLLKRAVDAQLSHFGISGSQWGVLVTLYRAQQEDQPSGLRLTDLGDRLLVRPPSVTGVVERLDRMGLLRRHPSPEDARAKLVRLTDAGRELAERVSQTMPDYVDSILVDLAPADRQELRDLLEKISGRLERMTGGSESRAGKGNGARNERTTQD